jgi:RimJ/RimL family protein N-acetyltransferase
MSLIVRTSRLELVPATLEIVEADLHRRDELPALLRAEIGEGWPPPLYDVVAMEWLKRSLQNDPTSGGWTTWYWIQRRPRVLIGLSGFKSRPVNGAVELGYSCLEKFQRRGFATEVVTAMVSWAFANGAEMVVAETLPELMGSQGVLFKTGFSFVGEGSEPGVIRFEHRRPTAA